MAQKEEFQGLDAHSRFWYNVRVRIISGENKFMRVHVMQNQFWG